MSKRDSRASVVPDGSDRAISPPVIEARGLYVGYGAIPVLHDINITVRSGEIVGILGPNGAGKTTTVLSFAGELKPHEGSILLDGRPLTDPLFRRARAGIAYLGEERSVFMAMSVSENLRVARADLGIAYELFPELKEHALRRTGLLSGG